MLNEHPLRREAAVFFIVIFAKEMSATEFKMFCSVDGVIQAKNFQPKGQQSAGFKFF